MNWIIGCGILIISLMAEAKFDTSTLLSIRLFNNSTESSNDRLTIDVAYDKSTCSLHPSRPLDVYFRDVKTGRRTAELSKNDQDIFFPKLSSGPNTNEYILHSKGLDDILEGTSSAGEIRLVLTKSSANCRAQAWVSYDDNKYVLNEVVVRMNAKSQLLWVRLEGQAPGEGPVRDCILGNCR